MCPYVFPSGPLPPQNLSLSHVTTNSALITWSRHPRHIPDGFVVNVTRGLNTRSRFLPNGKLGSYTVRELTPGQHYYVALTSVKNTGQEHIHSIPQHLAFTTSELLLLPQIPKAHSNYFFLHILNTLSFDPVPMEARSGRRREERPRVTGQGPQVGHTITPSQPQDLGGTAETDNSDELPRYTRCANIHY